MIDQGKGSRGFYANSVGPRYRDPYSPRSSRLKNIGSQTDAGVFGQIDSRAFKLIHRLSDQCRGSILNQGVEIDPKGSRVNMRIQNS